MRIPSGVTDQGFYFFAADATDKVTAETGLSSFTVYRSRNGAAEVAMTTPTITEIDATNAPGVYFLLCDEDMTIAAGDHSQAMIFIITHAGMAPVRQQIELYRPDVTAGETLNVSSGALNAISDGLLTAAKFGSDFITAAKVAADVGTEIATAVWASATRLLTAGTNIVLAKGTGVTGFNDLSAAQVNAEVDTAISDAALATAASLATVDGNVDSILEDTGTTLPGTLSTIAGYIDTEITTLQTTADAIETDTQDIQTTLAALSIPTANANADALLDRADAIETGLTLRGALRLNTAALAGKVSGAGTTSNVFRNAVADSKARITATVDSEGNRSAVTTDLT